MINIPEDLTVGKSFKIHYGEGNINNRVIHIRAIVDDDKVVFRWWSKGRQSWIYEVEHLEYFVLRNYGVLQPR